MAICCAVGCSIRSEHRIAKNVTLHRFPKNTVTRKKWILAVRRKNWEPSKNSVICSKHFTDDQFDRTSSLLVRLKEGAVPCIFDGYTPSTFETISNIGESSENSKAPDIDSDLPIDSMSSTKCDITSIVETSIPAMDTPLSASEETSNSSSYGPCSAEEVDSPDANRSFQISQLDLSPISTQNTTQNSKCPWSRNYQESIILQEKITKALGLKNKYRKKIEVLNQIFYCQKKKIICLKQVAASLKRGRFVS